MKVIHSNQLLTAKRAVLGASLTLLATALTLSSAQAKTVNVNSGPIINGLFARIVCPNVAAQAGGIWTGEYDRKRQTCEVNIPDPVRNQTKPTKRPPLKPPVKLLNIDAGRLWSQSHANQRCKQLAKKNNGRWTGNWSEKTADKPSYCQVEVLIPPPKNPTHKVMNIDAGRIWSQDHANHRCNALAKNNKGQWTGKFSTINHKSTCEIKIALVPPKPKPTHKMVNVDAGRIWSSQHANHRCKALAKNNKGQWTGKYETKNNRSSCQIKVAINHAAAPAPVVKPQPVTPPPKANRKTRYVSAGRMTQQWRANRKCKRIADEANGTWTGQWRKSNDQQEGACEIRFAGGAKQQTQQPAAPAAVPTTIVKDAAAGPIWDQAQANQKCPLIAQKNKGQWTGNWRKIGANHQSVCQIRVTAAGTSQPVVESETTYVPLPKPVPAAPASNVREIFAGPIWDQKQANQKCQLIAANNKGVWTGQWRKTGPNHNSLCSIRF